MRRKKTNGNGTEAEPKVVELHVPSGQVTELRITLPAGAKLSIGPTRPRRGRPVA
jgi:hypothetical protein